MSDRGPWRPVTAFLALVLGCAVLIAGTAALTGERIEENRARRFHRTLTELTGSTTQTANITWHGDTAFLCDGRALLRGTAAGYGGDIRWLAVARLGPPAVLHGVRITAHQETPGIADFLATPDAGWLATLHGRTADGITGTDAVSGATITSRAVKRALAAALTRPPLTTPACPS